MSNDDDSGFWKCPLCGMELPNNLENCPCESEPEEPDGETGYCDGCDNIQRDITRKGEEEEKNLCPSCLGSE